MLKSSRTNRLFALTGMVVFPSAYADEGTNDSGVDGGGAVLLLMLFVWLYLSSRKDELLRCPRCRYRAPRSEFSGSRCPKCGTCEGALR